MCLLYLLPFICLTKAGLCEKAPLVQSGLACVGVRMPQGSDMAKPDILITVLLTVETVDTSRQQRYPKCPISEVLEVPHVSALPTSIVPRIIGVSRAAGSPDVRSCLQLLSLSASVMTDRLEDHR